MILIGPLGKPREVLQREIPIHGLVKRLSGGNLMLNYDKSGVVQFLTLQFLRLLTLESCDALL